MPHLRYHHENPATLPAQGVRHLRGEGFRRVGASPGVLQHVHRGWFHRLLRGLAPDRDPSRSPLLHRRHPLLRRRGAFRRNRHTDAHRPARVVTRGPRSPPHPRPCTRPPISRACFAFRWPYPLSAGLAVYLLGLFTFAGLTAQANVNKPSKPRIGPASRHRRPQSYAPHPRPQRRAA